MAHAKVCEIDDLVNLTFTCEEKQIREDENEALLISSDSIFGFVVCCLF